MYKENRRKIKLLSKNKQNIYFSENNILHKIRNYCPAQFKNQIKKKQ